MKNFHIFLLSASFVAFVVGFSAYKLANPNRNTVASQNESGSDQSPLKDNASFQSNLVQVPENSSINTPANTTINSQNTNPATKKSATPLKKVYHPESEDEDDD
jgi:hypothetical protein